MRHYLPAMQSTTSSSTVPFSPCLLGDKMQNIHSTLHLALYIQIRVYVHRFALPANFHLSILCFLKSWEGWKHQHLFGAVSKLQWKHWMQPRSRQNRWGNSSLSLQIGFDHPFWSPHCVRVCSFLECLVNVPRWWINHHGKRPFRDKTYCLDPKELSKGIS